MAKTAKIKSCLVSKANWREKTEDVTVKLFANMLERQKDQKIQLRKNSLKRLRVQLRSDQ